MDKDGVRTTTDEEPSWFLALAVPARWPSASPRAATTTSERSGWSSSRRRRRRSTGTIAIDGSSTVAPFTEAAAELFNEENPDVQDHRRHVRHRRRLREVLRRRDRHLRRLAGDQGRRGGPRLREERRQVRRAADRQRRHRHRHEQGPGCRLPDDRRSSSRSGTRAPRSSRSRTSILDLPDTRSRSTAPGTDSGTFDFFTDEINGEEGVTREDYEASEDDNQLVTGVAGDAGGLGYFGFSYYEAAADQLNLVGVDSGDGLRQAVEGVDPGRVLQAARAPAVHVSERPSRSPGPRSRRSWTSSSPTPRRSPRPPRSSRSPRSRSRRPRPTSPRPRAAAERGTCCG